MKFRVTVLRQADREYQQILRYIAGRSKRGADAWARAYDKVLARLERNADSFPLAMEDHRVDFEVREILFKTRHGRVYRALFTIRGDEVLILHIRGSGQNLVDEEKFD